MGKSVSEIYAEFDKKKEKRKEKLYTAAGIIIGAFFLLKNCTVGTLEYEAFFPADMLSINSHEDLQLFSEGWKECELKESSDDNSHDFRSVYVTENETFSGIKFALEISDLEEGKKLKRKFDSCVKRFESYIASFNNKHLNKS